MATYYVDPVSGSDAADGLSFANAWLTTQKAADTAVAGDEVRLCATGTEAPSATIDFDTNAGPAEFVAYNATGTAPLGAGQFYTITGASIAASGDVIDVINGMSARFRRVRITGGPGVGVDLNGTCSVEFSNSRIDNHVSHGVVGDGAGSTFVGYSTEVDNNGGKGLTQTTSARFTAILDGCRIHHNGGNGVDTGRGIVAANNRIYRNGGVGIKADAGGIIANNILYLNTSDGVLLAVNTTVHSNSFVSNGGYGINFNAFSPGGRAVDWNHYQSNTSGETSLGGGSTPGDANQSGDPLFTSTTDGSEDFAPLTGSPLIGAGIGGQMIGAVAHADGGGSGNPFPSAGLQALESGVCA